MDNHYRVLLETLRGGLNRAVRYLNGIYDHYFNRRHARSVDLKAKVHL